jgi:hypothetical protein
MFKIRQNNKLYKSSIFSCCRNNNIHNLFSEYESEYIKNEKKLKVVRNYNPYVIPQVTQVQRATNSILYSLGGRTQYGYKQPQKIDRILLFGKLEGQNGGILAPLKNKF